MVDGKLDRETLRAMGESSPCSGYLEQPVWATLVDGVHAAIAVRREGGDGAQILVFAWDGRQFQLADMRHAVRVKTEVTAARYLRELLRQMGL